MKKRLQIVFVALVSLFMFTSCAMESSVSSAYENRISKYHSTSLNTDQETITEYLESKGLPIGQAFFINGESESENDIEAVSRFNEAIVKVTVAEIAALGLDPSTTFTVSVDGASTDPDADARTLASYSYPSK